jgi:hypothetical protein
MRVKFVQHFLQRWIIVPAENEHLAWSETRWVPVDRDGLPLGDDKVSTFVTVQEAVRYAENLAFEIQHG